MGWGIDPLKSTSGSLTPLAIKVSKLLGIESIKLDESTDVTGDWSKWFQDDIGAEVVLVRPDFYIGDACGAERVSDL